jgi:hypothetical protein
MMHILDANWKRTYTANVVADIDCPNASRGTPQPQEFGGARCGISIVKDKLGENLALGTFEPVNYPRYPRSLQPEVSLDEHECIIPGNGGNTFRLRGPIEHDVSQKSKGVPADERKTRNSVRLSLRWCTEPFRYAG